MWHCFTCGNYDLCDSCSNLQPTLTKLFLHNHPLFIASPLKIYPHQYWLCDICGSSSHSKQSQMHHCFVCGNFDLCDSCISNSGFQHPRHQHAVIFVANQNSSLIYPESDGKWFCDLCSRGDRYKNNTMYHCFTCREFDICGNCLKK